MNRSIASRGAAKYDQPSVFSDGSFPLQPFYKLGNPPRNFADSWAGYPAGNWEQNVTAPWSGPDAGGSPAYLIDPPNAQVVCTNYGLFGGVTRRPTWNQAKPRNATLWIKFFEAGVPAGSQIVGVDLDCDGSTNYTQGNGASMRFNANSSQLYLQLYAGGTLINANVASYTLGTWGKLKVEIDASGKLNGYWQGVKLATTTPIAPAGQNVSVYAVADGNGSEQVLAIGPVTLNAWKT